MASSVATISQLIFRAKVFIPWQRHEGEGKQNNLINTIFLHRENICWIDRFVWGIEKVLRCKSLLDCSLCRHFSYLLHIVFGCRGHNHLSDLPVLPQSGLYEDLVPTHTLYTQCELACDIWPVHPVVELLRLSPLHVQAAVPRAGQVGDQWPGK